MSVKAIFEVCRGKSCTRRGSGEIAAALEHAVKKEGLSAAVLRYDCFDLCQQACNVQVSWPGEQPRLYTELYPRQAKAFAEAMAAELEQQRPARQLAASKS